MTTGSELKMLNKLLKYYGEFVMRVIILFVLSSFLLSIFIYEKYFKNCTTK